MSEKSWLLALLFAALVVGITAEWGEKRGAPIPHSCMPHFGTFWCWLTRIAALALNSTLLISKYDEDMDGFLNLEEFETYYFFFFPEVHPICF